MTTKTEIHPPAEQHKTRNTVGLIALITAIVGAVFAMIPGALMIGWILLPIAFILSIISLFMKNQKRGQGIAALIISIVGTGIGFVVFFAVVASSVDEAFSEELEVASPAEGNGGEESLISEDEPAEPAEDAEATGEEGTRDNPLPLGTTISDGDWEVTLNSVDLDATEAVLAENPLNDEPETGNGYIMANVTATYLGDDSAGETPAGVRVEYVSAEGNSFDTTTSMVIVPDYFNRSETLYEGASTTGNFGVEVPLEDIENGNILVSPTMFGDGVFFEMQ
ncbi:MAG TPA: DUF308 domain-containing protein [Enteractinococcus sp.]